MNNMNIDLVYLWVDGNDPVWQAKRNAFFGKTNENTAVNCKGRFIDNDELKYSLRSIEKYAPWIRNIFIITDNQKPTWLDLANPRIKIIDLVDIMPQESLPCFNSSLIEKFLHKIPELSEHFLYSNDDMFMNKNVTPNDFFTTDGFPFVFLQPKPFRKIRWFWREKVCKKPLHNYSLTISTAAKMVEKKYGIYYNGMPHHNIDAYLKSDCERVSEQIFASEFKAIQTNHIRSSNDIQRIIYSYVLLAEKHGHLRYVTKTDSLHVQIHKENHYKKLAKYNPMLFCLNDLQYAQDSDRMRAKDFLNSRFPEKSSFEK